VAPFTEATAQQCYPPPMDTKRSKTASTTRLTGALAVGEFVCVGGGLATLFAGASAQIAAVALVTGAVLALSAVIYEYRRAPDTFLAMPPPFEGATGDLIPSSLPEEGESWLGIDAAWATRMKRSVRMAYAVPLILLVPWAWVRYDIADPGLPVGMRAMVRLLDIITAVMVLTCAVVIIFMRQQVKRTLRSRIGADRTHLLYDPGTGKVERYEWSSVLTDKFHLLVGRRIVALTRPLFPAERLRTLILARIPATSFVAQSRFNWNALLRGNPWFRAIIAALCTMAVLTLLRETHPEWSYAAFEALMAWLRASVS
jgi:hypothetical protein